MRTLSASAFLSSHFSTSRLVKDLLPAGITAVSDSLVEAALSSWSRSGGVNPPVDGEAFKQRSWDEPICGAFFDSLLQRADRTSRARLLAVASPDAGAWLHVQPCRNLGLCLSDRELRVAVGLRLGAPLVRPHTCRCGVEVDSKGLHGLSCRRSAGRQRRHAQANDVLAKAFRSVDVQVELEPCSLFRDDGKKRPEQARLRLRLNRTNGLSTPVCLNQETFSLPQLL